MRAQDIVIGETYRFKAHRSIGYAKALKVLKAKEGENTNTYIVVKCEHTYRKDDNMGFIRYFRPIDLIKEGL